VEWILRLAAAGGGGPCADIMKISKPVVLEDSDLPIWLGEARGDLTALLRPPPGGVLKCRALGQGSRGRR
jgi:gluconate kinase